MTAGSEANAAKLCKFAERSRKKSRADLLVADASEPMLDSAFFRRECISVSHRQSHPPELEKNAMASLPRLLLPAALLLGITSHETSAQGVPVVGQAAPDFRLPALSGEAVQLSKLTAQGPVVLVVLRGFPGYQCPACNAQTGQLLASAAKFAEKKANVVLVYPGPPPGLAQRAKEFANGKTWPENFHLVVDQDYALTNLYGLRWNAPNETAYPSTYVVDKQGKIVFAKTSKSHGGRASADEILKALSK